MENLFSPLTGTIVKLENVEDVVFASKVMGDGIGINPTIGKVYAPFDGNVVSLFPTNHAIGIKSKENIELLIHIGIDTVELEGNGFLSHIKQGDKIKKGDLLIDFDIEKIEQEGYSVQTMLVITNTKDYKQIEYVDKTSVSFLDLLLKLF